MTRQRRYQLRQRAAGLCIICPARAVTAIYCRRHADNDNARHLRAYYRTREGDPMSILADSDPDSDMSWEIAAAQILNERKRRAIERQSGPPRILISDPATSPQILAKYGLTRETAKARTRLLARARRGDPTARQMLRERYACTIWQRPEVEAFRRERP